MYFGAFKSTQNKKHFKEIELILEEIELLEPSKDTARIYGQVKNKLKLIGKPIPENDIWIAAIAIEYGLVLANNDKHFDYIEKFDQEKW